MVVALQIQTGEEINLGSNAHGNLVDFMENNE